MDRRTVALGVGATLLISPVARAGERQRQTFPWPGGARAAVSLTYDDGLDSQLDNAIPQLDARGLKGTFFLTRENMGDRTPDWQAAYGRGHEMEDHTLDHPCRLNDFTAESFKARELAPMEAFLDAAFPGPRVRTFAYPCDETELGGGPRADREARYAQLVADTFQAARTTDGPPNDPAEVERDRHFLHGFEPTYDHDDPRLAYRYLDLAIDRGAWAILIFHEVLPRRLGTGDTSLGVHAAILNRIRAQPLWCAPMGAVLQTILAS